MASAGAAAGRSLIIDTDAGFDDFLAIQCLLHHRTPSLVTTVGGVLPASRASATLRQLFPKAKVATGRDATLRSDDLFPDWLNNYRTTNLESFLSSHSRNISIPNPTQNHPPSSQPTHQAEDALTQVTNLLMNSEEDSVDIICIGPMTNLAHWAKHWERESHSMSKKIRHIWIMGGNHPRLSKPEFNFGWDHEAAQKVLETDHWTDKIHLVTSCSSNANKLLNEMGEEHLESFVAQTKRDAGFFRSLLEIDTAAYSLSCDPVCAFVANHPECVEWETVTVNTRVREGGVLTSVSESHPDGAQIRVAIDIDFNQYFTWIHQSYGKLTAV